MTIRTDFGIYKGVYFKVGKYRADNSLAIQAWNDTDGPIATLTVCLNKSGMLENESFVDTNNCPWVVELIEKEKLGELVGFSRSGYCTYPLVKFDMEQIKKHEREVQA